jgi:hypothetical protein
MNTVDKKKIWLRWNLKIHLYIGLFILFFIWLFGSSGLLLNHHWEFANFWEDREEQSSSRVIEIGRNKEPYVLAHEITSKLNLNGSIRNITFSNDSLGLNFIVLKPGTRYDVQAMLDDGEIVVKEMKFNLWGILRALHVLRNPSREEMGEQQQTILSSIWGVTIDVLSVSLIVLCLGGWIMWLRVPGRRFILGLISLTCGFILCICYILL